jgi:hypothetical protein
MASSCKLEPPQDIVTEQTLAFRKLGVSIEGDNNMVSSCSVANLLWVQWENEMAELQLGHPAFEKFSIQKLE